MNTWALVLVFAVVVAGVGGWLAAYVRAERVRREHLNDRPSLKLEEWEMAYYHCGSPRFVQVSAILRVLAEPIGVEPAKLRPGDDLVRDLGLRNVPIDDTADAWMLGLTQLARRLGRPMPMLPGNIRTVDDVIRAFMRGLAEGTEKSPAAGRGCRKHEGNW